MDKEKYGVHISHCCYIHGCKYGDEDCPVVSGEVAQKYLCYDCSEEYEPYTLEEIEQLRKTKSYRPTYEQLKDKVADLEAKLAESEKTEDGEFWFEKWQHKKRDYDSVYKAYIENCAEVDQLKQQLAEKDAEVQSWKDGTMVVKLGKLEEQLAEKDEAHMKAMQNAFNDFLQLRKEQNQTAIAELEKVIKFMKTRNKLGFFPEQMSIAEYIDQQIKSLKGEK